MAKISAVIITKNEEKNIGRCLRSLDGIVDEAIVMDSGSTDQTTHIVQEFKFAKLINTEWLGFAQTKNKGNQLANHEIILSLDADESLSDPLREEILRLKQSLTLNTAYWLPRRTNYCGQWIRFCGWRPDYQMRLFPKNKGLWVGEYVHEKLKLDTDINKMHLSGDILHYSYDSYEMHWRKVESYSTLSANEIVKRNENLLLAKALIRSPLRFIRVYFLKLGMLDGLAGFIIAVITARMVFIKYTKARKLKAKSAL